MVKYGVDNSNCNSHTHPVYSSQPYLAQRQKPQFPQQLSNHCHHHMTFRVPCSALYTVQLKYK